MQDIRKLINIVAESSAGTSVAGGIAGNGLGFASGGIGEKPRKRVEESDDNQDYESEEETADSEDTTDEAPKSNPTKEFKNAAKPESVASNYGAPKAPKTEKESADDPQGTPKMPEVIEYGNWENSALVTSNNTKSKRNGVKSEEGSVYTHKLDKDVKEDKKKIKEGKTGPGLWANIRARKASGKPMRKKGAKGAPTEKALKAAQAGSKNEGVEQGVAEGSEQRYAVTIDAIDHGVLAPVTVVAGSSEEAKQKAIASVKASMIKRGYELEVRSVSAKPKQGVAEGKKEETFGGYKMSDFEDMVARIKAREDKKKSEQQPAPQQPNDKKKVDEAELSEEQLQKKLTKELELFKQGKNKELSNRPGDRAIQRKDVAETSTDTLKNYKRASAGDVINRQNIANRTGRSDAKIAKRNAGQERAEQKLQKRSASVDEADMNRRGFLKGLGAAAATGIAGSALASGDTQNLKPLSPGYASVIRRLVAPHVRGRDRGQVVVDIALARDGTIIARQIPQSSRNGQNPEWDMEVLRAIDKVGKLPPDVDGRIPSQIRVRLEINGMRPSEVEIISDNHSRQQRGGY
jgi:colicin import membrane protein